MGQENYMQRIEELLRDMAALERDLPRADDESTRISLERSLKLRKKRFEHLIPFSFRQELRCLCKEVGVTGEFG